MSEVQRVSRKHSKYQKKLAGIPAHNSFNEKVCCLLSALISFPLEVWQVERFYF